MWELIWCLKLKVWVNCNCLLFYLLWLPFHIKIFSGLIFAILFEYELVYINTLKRSRENSRFIVSLVTANNKKSCGFIVLSLKGILSKQLFVKEHWRQNMKTTFIHENNLKQYFCSLEVFVSQNISWFSRNSILKQLMEIYGWV